jgi:hypothetical protein
MKGGLTIFICLNLNKGILSVFFVCGNFNIFPLDTSPSALIFVRRIFVLRLLNKVSAERNLQIQQCLTTLKGQYHENQMGSSSTNLNFLLSLIKFILHCRR